MRDWEDDISRWLNKVDKLQLKNKSRVLTAYPNIGQELWQCCHFTTSSVQAHASNSPLRDAWFLQQYWGQHGFQFFPLIPRYPHFSLVTSSLVTATIGLAVLDNVLHGQVWNHQPPPRMARVPNTWTVSLMLNMQYFHAIHHHNLWSRHDQYNKLSAAEWGNLPQMAAPQMV